MRYTKRRDVFEEGFLTQLAEDVLAGKPVKEIKRLTTAELNRIPEIYAQVDFEPCETVGCDQSILDYIESDKVYTTGNKKEILGRDIKAITSLMYLRPRTAYWKPDAPQIHDSSVSGGVPLPMLGFKRWRGIPYMAWNQLLGQTVNPKQPFVDDEGMLYDADPNQVYNIDLLLGYTLASTYYCEEDDQIKLSDGLGLQLLSYYDNVEWRPNYNDIHNFREHNMGNYKGSYASTYGAVEIKDDDSIPIHIHNMCNTPMRLMLSQRWIWYGNHRNSDMICDFQNWDNIPKSVDTMSRQMLGLAPVPDTKQTMKARFGIG